MVLGVSVGNWVVLGVFGFWFEIEYCLWEGESHRVNWQGSEGDEPSALG